MWLTSENHLENKLWLLISISCPYAYLQTGKVHWAWHVHVRELCKVSIKLCKLVTSLRAWCKVSGPGLWTRKFSLCQVDLGKEKMVSDAYAVLQGVLLNHLWHHTVAHHVTGWPCSKRWSCYSPFCMASAYTRQCCIRTLEFSNLRLPAIPSLHMQLVISQ